MQVLIITLFEHEPQIHVGSPSPSRRWCVVASVLSHSKVKIKPGSPDFRAHLGHLGRLLKYRFWIECVWDRAQGFVF